MIDDTLKPQAFEPQIDNPEFVHWSPRHGPAIGLSAGSGAALLGLAITATAFAALAVGAMAVGVLAIGRLGVGRADFRQVRIGRLIVDELVLPKR